MKTIIILFLACIANVACNNKDMDADKELSFLNDIPFVEGYMNLKLTDCDWKLIGFADAEQEKLKMVESGLGLREYFSLRFYDDNTLSGWSFSNEIAGIYETSSGSSMTIGVRVRTKVAETDEGRLYLECLNNVKTFSMTKKGLALHYESNKFLLFKPIEP